MPDGRSAVKLWMKYFGEIDYGVLEFIYFPVGIFGFTELSENNPYSEKASKMREF